MARIDRETMFLEIARTIAERSTCTRADVGAVIVKENRIISTGYNGAPPGMPHCEDVGCEVEYHDIPGVGRHVVEGCARTIHAEANAIAWAARAGVPVEGAAMFCTHAPCYPCAKLMVSAGIAIVHYHIGYRDTRGIELLDRALVKVKAHGQS